MKTKIISLNSWQAYLLLIAVLVTTIGCSFLPFGMGNDLLAWGFGFTKASIIFLCYMHARKELELSKVYFALGILTLIILLMGVLDDILLRTI
jgi:caa(3)-type oxidase subunit IV